MRSLPKRKLQNFRLPRIASHAPQIAGIEDMADQFTQRSKQIETVICPAALCRYICWN
jgi:hypothetical protein